MKNLHILAFALLHRLDGVMVGPLPSVCSLHFVYGRIDACCAHEAATSVTVTNVRVEDLDSQLVQGLLFNGQCVFGLLRPVWGVFRMVPPLCFKLQCPGRQDIAVDYPLRLWLGYPNGTRFWAKGSPSWYGFVWWWDWPWRRCISDMSMHGASKWSITGNSRWYLRRMWRYRRSKANSSSLNLRDFKDVASWLQVWSFACQIRQKRI